MSSYCYQAYGISIGSDIELPLQQSSSPASSVQLSIRQSDVSSDGLESPIVTMLHYQAKPNALWLNIPNLARFLMLDGTDIFYQKNGSVIDSNLLALQLVNCCMSAILHQRGMTVLRASAAIIDGKCAVFCGVSCQGKSLLAAALHKKGHSILSDNLCAIDEDGLLHPGPPTLNIWQDCFSVLEVKADSLKPVRPGLGKYIYPVDENYCSKAKSVDVIYLLDIHNKDTPLLVETSGINKVMPLQSQVHRLQYLEGLGLMPSVSRNLMKLANNTRVAQLTRPVEFKVAKWLELFENDIESHGTVSKNSGAISP